MFNFQSFSGVIVNDVKIDSPVQGKSGLKMGNIIYEINGCNVTSRTDWRSCIIKNLNLQENHKKVCKYFWQIKFFVVSVDFTNVVSETQQYPIFYRK